jgi:hypothetical protein
MTPTTASLPGTAGPASRGTHARSIADAATGEIDALAAAERLLGEPPVRQQRFHVQEHYLNA